MSKTLSGFQERKNQKIKKLTVSAT